MSSRIKEFIYLIMFRNKDDENDERSQYLCGDQSSGALVRFLGIINLEGKRISFSSNLGGFSLDLFLCVCGKSV